MSRIAMFNSAPMEGPLSIDKLVDSNGYWKIVYTYSRWGNNVLMILPNFGLDDDEEEINQAVIKAPNTSMYEMSDLIDQFLRDFPKTPFMVRALDIATCVSIMQDRLGEYGKDVGSFFEDYKVFDQWRHVLYMCSINKEDGLVQEVCKSSWKDFVVDLSEDPEPTQVIPSATISVEISGDDNTTQEE